MHATATGRNARPYSATRPSLTSAEHRPLTYNPFATQPLTTSGYASSALVNPNEQLRERDARRQRASHSATLAPRKSLSEFTRVASPPPINGATAPSRLPRSGAASAAARRPSRLALTAPAPARDSLTADLRSAPQHVVPHRAPANTFTLNMSQHPTHYTTSPYLHTVGQDPAVSRNVSTRPASAAAAQPRKSSGYRWTFLTEDAIADGRRLRASVRPPKARGRTADLEARPRALWDAPGEEEEEADPYRLKEALLAPPAGAARSPKKDAPGPQTAATNEAPIDGLLSFEAWLETVSPPTTGDGQEVSDDAPRESEQALATMTQLRAERMAQAYEALLEEMAYKLPYTRQEDRERLLRLKNDFAHHSLRLQCAYRHLPSRVTPAEEAEPCRSAGSALTPPAAGQRPPRTPGYDSMLQPMLPAWERAARQETSANAVLAQVRDPRTTKAPTALAMPYGSRADMRLLLQEHEAAAREADELERARERSFYETLNRYGD